MKHTLNILSLVLFSTFYIQNAFAQQKLEEVVVVASGIETPIRQVGASVSVISDELITLRGYTSVSEVLRKEVGVSSTSSGGLGKATSIRVRGEEGFRTLVMIDGVDISDPTGTQVMPQIQHVATASNIERMEILRGPQGFIYGADAGGVINILTKRESNGVSAGILGEYGRYDTSKLDGYIAAGDETADAFLSLTRVDSNGFNSRVVDPENEEDGYENTTAHSKLGWNPNDNVRAQLVLRDVSAESEYDCSSTNNDCVSTFDQSLGRFTLDFSHHAISHKVGLTSSDMERSSGTFSVEGKTEKVDYLGNIAISSALNIVAGLDYESEEVTPQGGATMERDQKGTFIELQTNINNAVFFTAGGRWDDNDDFGEHISYRVTSAYVKTLNESHTIKFRSSAGTGYRAPSLSEIAYNAGTFAFGEAADTILEEESSEGVDLGFDYFHENGANLSITYFYQVVENEIYFDLINFSGYLQGNGKSLSEGVEITSEIPLTDNIDLLANATYNETESTSDVQRPRRPKNSYNLGIQSRWLDDNLKTLISVRRVEDSVNDIFGVGRVTLDDYEVVDASTTYTIADGFSVFGRVENLTNESYEEITGFNTSGRAFYMGLRYDLD